jgi:hypothetical protein
MRKLIVSAYTTLDGVVQDPVGMENSVLGTGRGRSQEGLKATKSCTRT